MTCVLVCGDVCWCVILCARMCVVVCTGARRCVLVRGGVWWCAVVVVLQQQVRHVLLVAELVVAQQAHCTATTGTLLFATPSACYDENVHFQAHYKPYHTTTPLHVQSHTRYV